MRLFTKKIRNHPMISSRLSQWASKVMGRRDQLPTFLNRLIDDVAKRPDGLPARVVDALLLISQTQPVHSQIPEAPYRVFIGPTNYAGQGYAWARALEIADPHVKAINMEIELPGGFHFPANSKISISAYNRSRSWQKKQLEVVRSFTHVLYEAERPLFGSLLHRSLIQEIRALESSHVSVALMCHGTDVRSPSQHISTTPWSPYFDEKHLAAQHQKEVDLNLRLIQELQLPTFVSTPDLLLNVPQAKWCPVVVDVTRWSSPKVPLVSARPVVAHIPSMGVVKGTHLIEHTLYKLHKEGVIEYKSIRNVPASEMPAAISSADIVLDQFRIGSYGVAAVEAMASGRVVIGHVVKEVREIVLSETGIELPIVEATPATLDSVLREISGKSEVFQQIAQEGSLFAQQIHSGTYSASVLENYWIAKTPQTAQKG